MHSNRQCSFFFLWQEWNNFRYIRKNIFCAYIKLWTTLFATTNCNRNYSVTSVLFPRRSRLRESPFHEKVHFFQHDLWCTKSLPGLILPDIEDSSSSFPWGLVRGVWWIRIGLKLLSNKLGKTSGEKLRLQKHQTFLVPKYWNYILLSLKLFKLQSRCKINCINVDCTL